MTMYEIPEEALNAVEAGKWVFRKPVPDGAPLTKPTEYVIVDDPDDAPEGYVVWMDPREVERESETATA